jgi:hypothetical protein
MGAGKVRFSRIELTLPAMKVQSGSVLRTSATWP